MNRTDAPAKQPKPFGVNGQRDAILPTTPSGDNAASYESGFPPITMILKTAGGKPPKGQNMNQILYELSALGRWSSTGSLNSYDSAFSTAIGGYPSGAQLISDDQLNIYINTVDGNTTNPNTGGAGWKTLTNYLNLSNVVRLSDWTASFGTGNLPASGWIKHPNGVIEQFFTVIAPAGGSTPQSVPVTFPIPFPNQVLTVRQGIIGTSDPSQRFIGYNSISITLSGMTLTTVSATSNAFTISVLGR